MLYAEVVLPLAVADSYHYHLPDTMGRGADELVGCRVQVSFGARRFYTGLILSVSHEPPQGINTKKLKGIEQILDTTPIATSEQLLLWRRLAHYYHCTLGQVLRSALPSGLLPESQTLLYLNDHFAPDYQLSLQQNQILDVLASAGSSGLSMATLRHRLGSDSTPAITTLMALGAITTEEVIRQRFKPRLRPYIRLTEAYRTETAIEQAYLELRRSSVQQAILTDYLSHLTEHPEEAPWVERPALLSGESHRAKPLRRLIERGILEQEMLPVSRLMPISQVSDTALLPLRSVELHASGVRLLYDEDVRSRELSLLSYVDTAIRAGQQVLLLTPTAQDTPSADAFREKLSVVAHGAVYEYHSGISQSRCTELYLRLLSSREPCVVVGTRSAIFLPLGTLGLIIIDQEHEYLYKQQYTAPYYHARDVALLRSSLGQVPVLLSSSTPSAEVLFNVLRGKYSLDHHGRPEGLSFPEIEVLDMSQLAGSITRGTRSLISPRLRTMIGETIARGERVLLLQNRRGYAPRVECQACHTTLRCPYCDVSLIYYGERRQLRCNYCSLSMPMPSGCPSCGVHRHGDDHQPALRIRGYGTERIVEEVESMFEGVSTLRIDSDSLQSAVRRAEIHAQIATGDVDILVGTQLIKGQPIWEDIGLIAVLELDAILAFSDVRADERAYQLLHQLQLYGMHSRHTPRLVLQTYQPEHSFITELRHHDYGRFIRTELQRRKQYHKPPLCRLITIRLRHSDEGLVEHTAQMLSQILIELLGNERVSAPQTPVVGRVEMQYLRQITLSRPYSEPYAPERLALTQGYDELLRRLPEARKVRIAYDVDPL